MCVSVGQKRDGVRATIIRIVGFRALIGCCYRRGHTEKDTGLPVQFAVFRRYFALDCGWKMCVLRSMVFLSGGL